MISYQIPFLQKVKFVNWYLHEVTLVFCLAIKLRFIFTDKKPLPIKGTGLQKILC